MSVLLVTSLGDIVIDLYPDKCPLTCKNFLKLCKIKYYDECLFHKVQKDFIAQTGDPTGTGTGGDSIYKFLYGEHLRFFGHEIHPELNHSKAGTVAMASAGENLSASQFYFTLRDDLDYLDGKHTVFGKIAEAEGFQTLAKINEAYVDEQDRPYINLIIHETHVLEDPFEDPPQLAKMIADEGKTTKDDVIRLEAGWVPMDEKLGPQEVEEVIREKAAHSSAVVLECIGDIPAAEVKPPDNVLFVRNLNPLTQDEDLRTIFTDCAPVLSAKVIRDYKTGESLCYAFIEFESKKGCKKAYRKMGDTIIDDRRIRVDFSQSVSKFWPRFRRKDSQFEKGSADCVAKDSVGRKYIVKDQNRQHWRGDGYEMVFEGDIPKSPKMEKKRDKAGLCDGRRREFREMERRYDDGLNREKKLAKKKRKRQ